MPEISPQQTSSAASPSDTGAETGIDITLLQERLKLTVTERWERNFQAVEVLKAFREAGRARRAETAAPTDRTKR